MQKYNEEMLTFLRQHAQTPRIELTALFNATFNVNYPATSIRNKCQRMGLKTGRTGCFEKGLVPWNLGKFGYMSANATSFKTGHTPWTSKPIGFERTMEDGYIEVKIANPDVFKRKHRIVWESHNGVIPDDCVIVFKNKDKQDCRIENLMLITRSELICMNRSFSKLSTPETHETCILLARLKDKTLKLRGSAA